MALLQTSLTWIVYAIAIAFLLAVASIFIYVYQTPRERSPSVTLVSILAITTLLATVLLLPVDVALVSSTTSSQLGRRKDWATQDEVDKITYSLTVVYYLLYSLDAVLCLLVIPFTYFWYEEYDEVATESGEQTIGKRFWSAFRYTIAFILVIVILFLVGFFVPITKNKGQDLDYFRKLLTENRKIQAPSHLLVQANAHRWRTNTDLCTRIADNGWSMPLCHLHLFGSCPPSHQVDQDCSVDFKPEPKSNHCGSIGVKPRASTAVGRPLQRGH